MKLFAKILVGLVFLVVIVVGAGLYYVFDNINVLVKDAVERVGPRVTQTEVKLDKVDITLRSGRVELNDFLLGNPEGFSADRLMSVKKVVLQVEPLSLNKDVIIVKEMTIEGINIVAEEKALTTNIQALLKNLESSESEPKKEEPAGQGADLRFALEKIRFADSNLKVISEKHGEYTLELPSFDLTNIGSAQNGLSPQELGPAILGPLFKKAKQRTQEQLRKEAKKAIKSEAEKQAKEKLKEKFGDDAEEKLNKLKGLLGN